MRFITTETLQFKASQCRLTKQINGVPWPLSSVKTIEEVFYI